MKPFGGGLYFRGGPAVGNYSSDRFAILYGGNNAYGGDVAFFGATAGVTSCLLGCFCEYFNLQWWCKSCFW